ncbi:MAG TPA: ParB N-terminal domain-containing protein [Nostocaceae cyanobacterium]|nr:ParB N-terminal domain-containing protein [Nostocaceae cyanobacterium]
METRKYLISELLKMGNPKNPRWMPDDQAQALESSIQRFGMVEPVLVNIRTKRIVGGHQRVQAANNAGLTELDVFIVDLPEDKEMALNLSLNKIKGDWDYDKLAAQLAEIDQENIIFTGFSTDEVNSIVADYISEMEEELFDDPDDGSQVVEELRNRSEEEVEEQFNQTVKVQFGMFSKNIEAPVYEQWIEGLAEISTNGSSPAALGLIVAQMLQVDVISKDQPATEETGETDKSESVAVV